MDGFLGSIACLLLALLIAPACSNRLSQAGTNRQLNTNQQSASNNNQSGANNRPHPNSNQPTGASNQPPVTAASWSIQLKTSGGFVGTGAGNLWIDSAGNFKYDPPKRPGQTARACEQKFTSSELQTVADAVGGSKPDGWQRPGLDVAAPDAFGYQLELHRDPNQVFNVSWHDNTRDKLPDDLKQLSDTLLKSMQLAAKKCSN